METKIILKDVSKFYGKKQALNNINLEIEKGMFGLLGRNGAGKTTLMKSIATLLSLSSGNITVCGISVNEGSKIREMIGYLPQDFSMYSNMSAYEAMDYLGVLSGLDKKSRKERIPQMLSKVNLNNNMKTKVKAMSGGMRRRLGIAQAILHNPKVLIVDEPTAGLDPEERVRFRNLLSEIAEDRIVILSTHIVGDIESTCENIAVMDEGKIIFKGSVIDLLDKANGNIYEAKISRAEIEDVKKKYIVTNVLMMSTDANVRFIAKNKSDLFEGAEETLPNVEDAYMYLMNTSGGMR
ncbi:ABC transporter ATP-binding protein [Romboutsia sedimentorum]|uniref:ABC transporter ATP-binding protein n=1 Tax=Romboutsia sedimentorum TaxID=1368474 RepID=A0ABT7E5U4_9FIRM|nr:ABC transporter ATP-binding protein [Romboutsia sedimentorum]MDK2562299.1 ABC transporter ATP-binding protein [Romboutsia sedimentorum]